MSMDVCFKGADLDKKPVFNTSTFGITKQYQLMRVTMSQSLFFLTGMNAMQYTTWFIIALEGLTLMHQEKKDPD